MRWRTKRSAASRRTGAGVEAGEVEHAVQELAQAREVATHLRLHGALADVVTGLHARHEEGESMQRLAEVIAQLLDEARVARDVVQAQPHRMGHGQLVPVAHVVEFGQQAIERFGFAFGGIPRHGLATMQRMFHSHADGSQRYGRLVFDAAQAEEQRVDNAGHQPQAHESGGHATLVQR